MNMEEKESFARRYEIIAFGDGKQKYDFFYGVKTTGIFCRPGCASRLPNQENVLFFDSVQDALKAGFRPCKRCNPMNEWINDHAELVTAVCRIIENTEKEPTLKQLADKTGYSEGHLQRVFTHETGISPRQYSSAIKRERFTTELARGASVTESIYTAGYSSSSRVYGEKGAALGMTPTQYKSGGRGLSFRIGVFPCTLGVVLIALTGQGAAAVDLGDDPEELKKEFRKKFSDARIGPLNENDEKIIEKLLRKIDNPEMDIDIPLDIHGTVFQQRVWNALRTIPAGETRTYSEVAEKIGSPSSVRAVANACGQNNLAVVIPCHRVVRKDGGIAGYRWGEEKKKRLLEKERETDSVPK